MKREGTAFGAADDHGALNELHQVIAVWPMLSPDTREATRQYGAFFVLPVEVLDVRVVRFWRHLDDRGPRFVEITKPGFELE